MKIELAKTEIIHFVGIGGIGMSGLALIMKGMGFNVQGSDIINNKNIDRLKKNRIKIFILSFFNLSIFLFKTKSLPWTLNPFPFIIKESPLIPIPPIPTKCTISVFANSIFINNS